jgi:tRNA modification GTPase
MVVLTKADLAGTPSLASGDTAINKPMLMTSSHTGAGLDALCTAFRELLLTDAFGQPRQVVAATADRCRESIRIAAVSLGRAKAIANTAGGNELLAAELRIALSELGKVVGAVYTDDVLDRIFSRFCIGK